jgi:hypothetical protein
MVRRAARGVGAAAIRRRHFSADEANAVAQAEAASASFEG